MGGDGRCDNEMCTCSPCTPTDCRCGIAPLGQLERRVMDILWQEPGTERTGRDVAGVLPGYAYTTVATELDRLVHKGLVRRRMDGRTIRFAVTATRGAHTAKLMYETLEAAGEPDEALVRFARTVSNPEAEVLRRALRELEARPAGAERSPG